MLKMTLQVPTTRSATNDTTEWVEHPDYESLVMDACQLLSSTDCRFHVSGFGIDEWKLDVAYDLSVVIEQLPDVLQALRMQTDVQLDMYSQGVERTLDFRSNGDVVSVICSSRTSWIPRPQKEELQRAYLVEMFERLAKAFADALAVAAPPLARAEPFNSWRGSVV